MQVIDIITSYLPAQYFANVTRNAPPRGKHAHFGTAMHRLIHNACGKN
jgi:hypothetical protein